MRPTIITTTGTTTDRHEKISRIKADNYGSLSRGYTSTGEVENYGIVEGTCCWLEGLTGETSETAVRGESPPLPPPPPPRFSAAYFPTKTTLRPVGGSHFLYSGCGEVDRVGEISEGGK